MYIMWNMPPFTSERWKQFKMHLFQCPHIAVPLRTFDTWNDFGLRKRAYSAAVRTRLAPHKEVGLQPIFPRSTSDPSHRMSWPSKLQQLSVLRPSLCHLYRQRMKWKRKVSRHPSAHPFPFDSLWPFQRKWLTTPWVSPWTWVSAVRL